jgi:hypothetical protein
MQFRPGQFRTTPSNYGAFRDIHFKLFFLPLAQTEPQQPNDQSHSVGRAVFFLNRSSQQASNHRRFPQMPLRVLQLQLQVAARARPDTSADSK